MKLENIHVELEELLKEKSPLTVYYKVKILVLLIGHKFKCVPYFKKYYNFFIFNNCKNK